MTDSKEEFRVRFEYFRPNKDESDSVDNMNDIDDSAVPNMSDNSSPDASTDPIRNRRQVPMYLPEDKATSLNDLYDRLDGRSKTAGEGGLEKHAEFMETLVDLATEHEEELVRRLNIDQD